MLKTITALAATAVTAGALAAGAMLGAGAALAAAPVPFPVYDSGQTLVTAHPVTSGERLVIRGRAVELGVVDVHGPAFVAHPLGLLPKTWKGHTLAAVIEG